MLAQLTTILYLSGDPVSIKTLASLLATTEETIHSVLPDLEKSLDAIGLSLLLGKEGLSIVTQVTQAPLVEAFWKRELEGELTPASLQVLTLTAYLGSPTREEISYIRGVQSSVSIRTLTVRGLITRTGEKCTLTTDALKYLGITKVEDLPEYNKIESELREKLETRSA